jgi:hypothetical protein
MGFGLAELGRNNAKDAIAGMASGAESNYARNSAQKQIDNAEEKSKQSMAGTVAGMGAQYLLTDKGAAAARPMMDSVSAAARPAMNSMGSALGLDSSIVGAGNGEAASMIAEQTAGFGAEGAAMTNAALSTEAAAEAGMLAESAGASTVAGSGGAALSTAMPWIAGAFLLSEMF